MQGALWNDLPLEQIDEVRALVALSLVPGVGPGRIRTLVDRFGTASRVLSASVAELVRIEGVGRQTSLAIAAFDSWDEVDRQFDRALEVDAHLIVAGAPPYPSLLAEIYDPPAYLWVRGHADLDTPSVALVGTRRPTDYGRRVTSELAAGLADVGITVVSGMAYGIDSVAHEATLAAGGTTIGVLGSGVDVIYPTRNLRLSRRMIDSGGAIVSEFGFGSQPDASNFPRRNRIVSGLCQGTVIIEAYEGGGALITARMALEQNREVFAVPSAIHSRAGDGTNALIRDGHARLVRSVEDILNELTGGFVQVSASKPLPGDLTDVERAIIEAVADEPLHIDTLCSHCNLDPSTALVHLLNLEFRGLVRQMAGKHFVRA
jgi:DNA processing protein